MRWIPKDPEAAYTIGVIDWTLAHENTLKALVPAGVNDDGEGNVKAPKKVMQDIAAAECAAGGRGSAVSQPGGRRTGPTTTTPWPT